MSRRVFADFDDQLNLRLGKRADVSAAMRAQFLNDAILKLSGMYVHTQLQGVSAGTLAQGLDSFVPTETDLWWPEVVKDLTSGRILNLDDKENIEQMPKRAGVPALFYWFNDTFYVDVLADAARSMRVWYIRKPATFSAGSPVLGEEYDPLVLMWAGKIGFESVRDFDEADAQGKQISMFLSGVNFPPRQAKLNDQRTGIKVRMR